METRDREMQRVMKLLQRSQPDAGAAEAAYRGRDRECAGGAVMQNVRYRCYVMLQDFLYVRQTGRRVVVFGSLRCCCGEWLLYDGPQRCLVLFEVAPGSGRPASAAERPEDGTMFMRQNGRCDIRCNDCNGGVI